MFPEQVSADNRFVLDKSLTYVISILFCLKIRLKVITVRQNESYPL
jgi:hypothetical protein